MRYSGFRQCGLLRLRVAVALFAILCLRSTSFAQVGEYRTDFAVGFNGGYTMSSVAFVPKVPQGQLGGLTGGFTARYTCEKYFKSICAVVAEVNYAQTGWKENILDKDDKPVAMHNDESQTLQYSRKMTYVQVPLLARMGWGRERRGMQFFFQLGPQFGLYLNDQSDTNFDVHDPAFNPGDSRSSTYPPEYQYGNKRSSYVVAQDTMAIENKLDYGIAVGAGLEFSNPKLGHILLEGRYYYGLGNLYGSTKRDYFARSNFGTIYVKLTYLFDIVRTKNSKIK